MKSLYLLIVTVCLLVSSTHAQETQNNYVQLSDPVEQTDTYQVFGSTFNKEIKSVALDSLIAKSNAYKNQTITTQGTIEQVCQKKGCFFMLKSEEGEHQARISFKDYSFFIPTNTAGSTVKLNGRFSVKTISEEDAKHYAEDAGEDFRGIKGSQKEYSLVASSVKIYK